MESDGSHKIVVSTAQRSGENPSAARIAEAVVATLREISAILTPMIGQGEFCALYRRSLHLCTSLNPCLNKTHERVDDDFARLRCLLEQQNIDTATIYGDELLNTFYELLNSLIGISLSEHLLRSAWGKHPPTPNTPL